MIKKVTSLAACVAIALAASACNDYVPQTALISLETTAGTAIETTGTTGIPITTSFYLNFQSPVQTSSVNSLVTMACAGSPVTITFSPGTTPASSRQFTVTPSASLPPNTACVLTVPSTVRNTSGIYIAGATFSFMTENSTFAVTSVTGTQLTTTTTSGVALSAATGIGGSSAYPLTATFPNTMDGSTMSNGTVTCGTAQTAPFTPTTNTTVYTITPSAWPQLTACTLTLPASIKDANGNALTAATLSFTTGCATNDDFGTDTVTGGCWTPITATGTAPAVASGALGFTYAGNVVPPSTPAVYKTFASIASGFTVTTQITATGASASNGCVLLVGRDITFADGQNALVGMQPNTAAALYGYISAGALAPAGSLSTGSFVCLAVAADGSISVGQGASASACSPSTSIASADTIHTSGSAVVVLTSINGDGVSTACSFDNFTVTGATATSPKIEY